MTYAEKLKDPRWQKKRLEIFNRDFFCCQYCFNPNKTLHVHHKIYVQGKEPWDYIDDHLITVCETCHQTEKELKEKNKGKLQNLMDISFSQETQGWLITALENCHYYLSSEVLGSMIAELIKSRDIQNFLFRRVYRKKKK